MFEVYTRVENCTWCDRAKKLLQEKKIKYKEHIIGIHILREAFLEYFPTQKTVPLIIDDGMIIGGYDQLVEYLKNKDNGPELLVG